MTDVLLHQRPGEVHALTHALRTALRGAVIAPGDATYDQARRVWNGLIDRRPAVIARCADTQDVVETVRLAAEFRPLVSVRGGGHQIAGSAVCDDGLVIDLSAMKRIEVDAERRRVRAQGGVTWGELDAATQQYGLAVPGGEVSTTGIGGFTLGGGMGLLMRAHGLACDNVRSAEVVTADGVVRTANREENPDLFWALRGGGRGIGVVTWFEFDLHPIGPDVAVAQVFYPYADAERILRAWPAVATATPDTVTPQILLWSVPPDPGIPAEFHGLRTVIVMGMFAGPVDQAGDTLRPLREFGPPLFDASGTYSYLAIQSSVDELLPAGIRCYMKSHFMDDLNADVVATLLDADARIPTPETLVAIRTMGGAISRMNGEGSAFPHRTGTFNVSMDAVWKDAALDDQAIGWARATWDALTPHATGGVYVNFSGFAGESDTLYDAVFGSSARRLAEVRERYDRDGLLAAAARQP